MKNNLKMSNSESKNLNRPFSTLKEAQQWIESVEKFGEKYDLVRMKNACHMLDNPQDSFQSIHIGGTNGKGSTLQYLNRILIESGYNVGTFTSPYIVHFNERITLNNIMISDALLLHYLNVIYNVQKDYLEQYNDQITFFELITLISFLYFKDEAPDIVLYEVGLGGLLDATNVITPILSIITSIGFDHMGVLGNTLTSIATNKLGIVKKNIPLVTGIDQEELFEQFNSYTNKMSSCVNFTHDIVPETQNLSFPTSFTLRGQLYQLNMHGAHQVRNAIVALESCNVLRDKYHFSIDIHHEKLGLEKAIMPGRFEIIKGMILDGAHNVNGLEASLKTLLQYYPHTQTTVIFTVMADKEYLPMIKLLEKYVDTIIFTQIPSARSEKAQTLYNHCSHEDKYYFERYEEAYEYATKQNNGITLITGSLYFISRIREYILTNH